MHIDWAHFSPGSALAGGALIGVAAALLALGAGRILGAVGLFAGVIDGPERVWRIWALAGLLGAPTLARTLWGAAAPQFETGFGHVVAAGLLVGYGARLANGCTSGHGVCGLARLSPRSLLATLVFMTTGFASVFIVRHVLV
jgi:uncharacterized membrane protein YedE/YeeE